MTKTRNLNDPEKVFQFPQTQIEVFDNEGNPIETIAMPPFDLIGGIAVMPDSPPTTPPVTPPTTTGLLHTVGSQIVDSDGNAVVLRGVNHGGLSYRKTGDGLTQASIDHIASDWNASIVRLPFNQDWVIGPNADPTYLKFMDEVIGWINDAGMYCLLDLQVINRTVKIAPLPDSNSAPMWRVLANRHKDNPMVIYDLYNEPHPKGSSNAAKWAQWHPIATEMIDAIRAEDPDSFILVGGTSWSADLSQVGRDPILRDNIGYKVHEYPWKNPKDRQQRWQYLVGQVPLFFGECGGELGNLSSSRTSRRSYEADDGIYWDKLSSLMRTNGIGYTAWNWVNFPLLTVKGRSDFTPTVFGELVRADMRK